MQFEKLVIADIATSGPGEEGIIASTQSEIAAFVASVTAKPFVGTTSEICGNACNSHCWCCESLAGVHSMESIMSYATAAFPPAADKDDEDEDDDDDLSADAIADMRRSTLMNFLSDCILRADTVNVSARFKGCMGPLHRKAAMAAEPTSSEVLSAMDTMLEPIVEHILSHGRTNTANPESVQSSGDEPPAKRACVGARDVDA